MKIIPNNIKPIIFIKDSYKIKNFVHLDNKKLTKSFIHEHLIDKNSILGPRIKVKNFENDFIEIMNKDDVFDNKILEISKEKFGYHNYDIFKWTKDLINRNKITNHDQWLDAIQNIRQTDKKEKIIKSLCIIFSNSRVKDIKDSEKIFNTCVYKKNNTLSSNKTDAILSLINIKTIKDIDEIVTYVNLATNNKGVLDKDVFTFTKKILLHPKNGDINSYKAMSIVTSSLGKDGKLNKEMADLYLEMLNNKKIDSFKALYNLRSTCLSKNRMINPILLSHLNNFLNCPNVRSSAEAFALMTNYHHCKNTSADEYYNFTRKLLKTNQISGEEILASMLSCQDKNGKIDFKNFKSISQLLVSETKQSKMPYDRTNEKFVPDDISTIFDSVSGFVRKKAINPEGFDINKKYMLN